MTRRTTSTRARRSTWTTGSPTAFWRRMPRPHSTRTFRSSRSPIPANAPSVRASSGSGKVEDYSAQVVYRHEQTLSGPKKDRQELLRHTRGHFGQIFMLYPDREGAVDKLLQEAAAGAPVLDVLDGYQARHRVWAITDPVKIARIQELMTPRKLLIADGHHRYETALAYRNEHPGDPAAQYVMMTFVNMYSPGLKILATHRVLRNLTGFDEAAFFTRPARSGT